MIRAAFALWAARRAPRITNWFLPFAAMAIAFPFASMARSIALPLTIRALELGKSLTTLGGRPIFSALLKSVLYPGCFAVMALPPQTVLGVD